MRDANSNPQISQIGADSSLSILSENLRPLRITYYYTERDANSNPQISQIVTDSSLSNLCENLRHLRLTNYEPHP